MGTRVRGPDGRFQSSRGMFTTNTLERGLAQFDIKMIEGIEEVALDFAVELLDYAKANAPWNDRTGAARAGLDVAVDIGRNENLVISLFHTVDYGQWLEVRWGGKYAVIIPTIERKGTDLLVKMRGMMDRIIFYE